MANDQHLDTHQKALSLNLDDSVYGSLVEIGAGQEVAAHLFRAGGAAGTIAKTMSAYDMKVSDEIYGKVSRYVSRERLVRMVDREYDLLEERLKEQRGEKSRFFSFANTVSAKNYQGTNICHGWIGVRYQISPQTKTSSVVLHVNMRDETNIRQQQALGIIGINLIYAAYNYDENLSLFLDSLLDSLRLDRMEVDYIHAEGPAFAGVDNVELNLELVKRGLCRAVMFTPEMEAAAPVDLLYKRPIVIERGLFRYENPMYLKLLERAEDFLKTEGEMERDPTAFFEVTVKNAEYQEYSVDKELVQHLSKWGRPVMVSSYAETFHLTGFLSRYTDDRLRFVLGIGNLMQVMQERYYQNLDSGILSAMSLLFARDVKIYVFGMEVDELKKQLGEDAFDVSHWNLPETGVATLQNISPVSYTRHLYRYLLEKGAFLDVPLSSQ